MTNIPSNFQELGLAPALLKVLGRNNISTPTPIQHQAIPVALQGKDLIGIAQTGTGKTFSFGFPMLQRLASGKGRGLVLAPTRELAYQIEESLKEYATAMNIRLAVVVGGVSMHLQRKMFTKNPRILIATPGRLVDHLEQGTVTLREVNALVLDEADRMLDMGFKPQINRILKHVPDQRQTLLFSATMDKEILALATKEMQLPLRIEVAPAGTTADKVEQEVIVVKQEDKTNTLLSLLQEHSGSTLVFMRTKYGAKRVTRNLNAAGVRAAEIHSNRSLAQRRAALEGFKTGKHRVLVATDIAARGIDVDDIALVINYDLPSDPADYVHRIGRTGRAGRSGLAISLATPTQAKDIKAIERLTKATLRRRGTANLPQTELEKPLPKPNNKNPQRKPHRRRSKRGGKRNRPM